MSIEVQTFLQGHNFTQGRRPPVGEENDVTSVDGRMSAHSSVSGKSEVSTATPRRTDKDLGYEPEGSDSPLPPHKRWKLSLHNLLGDNEGLQLFKLFLQSRKEDDLLQCWLAFKGFKTIGNKRANASGTSSTTSSTTGVPYEFDIEICNKRRKTAKVIYKRFLDTSVVVKSVIKDATKSYIKKQIKAALSSKQPCAEEIDFELTSVFEQAQNEIEKNFERTAYPAFLISDLFYNSTTQFDSKAPKTTSTASSNLQPKQSSNNPSSAEAQARQGHYLPRLDEDAVWAPNSRKPQNKHQSGHTQGDALCRTVLILQTEKAGYPSNDMSRPAMPYYMPTAGCWVPPASANVSDQASSDATSDTLSITDGSVDAITFPPTRKGQKRLVRSHIKKNTYKDIIYPEHPTCHFPQRPGIKLQADLATKHPETFFLMLKQRLEAVLDRRKVKEETDQILESHIERVLKTPIGVQSPSGRDSPQADALKQNNPAQLHSNKRSPNKNEWDQHKHGGVQSTSSNETLTNKSQEMSLNAVRKQGVPGMPLNAVPDIETPDNPLDRQQMIRAWVKQNTYQQKQQRSSKPTKGLRKDGEGAILNPHIQTFVANRAHQVQYLPQQPISQDPTMPPLEAPNTNNTIEEVKRRLIEETEGSLSFANTHMNSTSLLPDLKVGHKWMTQDGSSKQDYSRFNNQVPSQHGGLDGQTVHGQSEIMKSKHKEQTETTVIYQLPGETDFYKVRTDKSAITLAHFKSLLLKKGNFKFFFKQYSYEIASDAWVQIEKDDELLPYWENKIVAKVEKV